MELPTAPEPLTQSRVRDGLTQTVLENLGLPVALGAACLIMLPLIQRVHVAEYDEAVLLDAARNVTRGGLPLRSIGAAGTPLIDHTPLYPYLLSLYAPAAGNSLFFARAVTLAAALLCIVLTYKIAVSIGGKAAGAVAALLLAVNPFFIVYSYFIRMELFMVLAVLLALLLLIRRRPPATAEILLAGGVLAVGCLFKEFALVFAGPAALYVWFTVRGSIGRRGLSVLALVSPPILALIGWGLWVKALWPAEFPSAVQRWLHSAAGGAALDPRMSIGASAWTRQLAQDLFGPGLLLALLVALLALALVRKQRPSAPEALLWGYLAAAVALSYLTRLREPRHLIAVIPCAAILGGVGLASLYRAGQSASSYVRAGLEVLIAVLLVLAGPWRPAEVLEHGLTGEALAPIYRSRLLGNDRFYGVLAQTGNALCALTGPDEMIVVAHQGPVVAYYADRHYVMLYTETEPGIMQALKKARFLVWDAPTFLALDANAVAHVQAAVAAGFELEEEVRDDDRAVGIYKHK